MNCPFLWISLLASLSWASPLQDDVAGSSINQNDTLVASPEETASGRIIGWVSQPNSRGTWDIIWTSLATIFICTYTMLNLNVPAPKDTWLRIQLRRLKWMALGIMGPEFVLTYAAGQWSRACQSVEAFHSRGHLHWSIRLAFFADMGGFVLYPKDSAPFPLNAKQLYWLVINKHIDYPEVTDEEMWDKSKQDRLAKVITSMQIGYLVLQCIGRAAQKLAITTLELNALAIVVTSLMTSYFWLHKPLDVRTPIRIDATFNMKDIAKDRPWNLTPLDFIDENGPGFSANVMPFMKMPVVPKERPIRRIPNDRFPTDPYGIQEYLLCLASLLFTAVHVAGWNFSFPTHIEQNLWRASSLLLFGITAAFWILETAASWTRLGRWNILSLDVKILCDWVKCKTTSKTNLAKVDGSEKAKDGSSLPQGMTSSLSPLSSENESHLSAEPTPVSASVITVLDSAPNPSSSQSDSTFNTGSMSVKSKLQIHHRYREYVPDPETSEYTPTVLPVLWEVCAITPLAVLYALGRIYLIVEAFLELRSLQASAYVNVNWSNFLPHV